MHYFMCFSRISYPKCTVWTNVCLPSRMRQIRMWVVGGTEHALCTALLRYIYVIYIFSLNTMYMYYVYVICHICTHLMLVVCSPLSTGNRALLMEYVGLVIEYRVLHVYTFFGLALYSPLSVEYRALLIEYRNLWIEYIVFLSVLKHTWKSNRDPETIYGALPLAEPLRTFTKQPYIFSKLPYQAKEL